MDPGPTSEKNLFFQKKRLYTQKDSYKNIYLKVQSFGSGKKYYGSGFGSYLKIISWIRILLEIIIETLRKGFVLVLIKPIHEYKNLDPNRCGSGSQHCPVGNQCSALHRVRVVNLVEVDPNPTIKKNRTRPSKKKPGSGPDQIKL